ncbi:family 43 glycosylhydrolase [Shewanella avicenniae]|uniref:Family 43 glycosylhydrolase n=1 Tax=Shewanella avicenniae TaxID=2814294 RepID=A0ABX7QNS3_9GAMM|nr:LamG-like jellyroll fold domain-containing protein [Shewanella avicenniae]QSX33122.1 family 43 glycosylhydrolase [Shewanella avicenniae]
MVFQRSLVSLGIVLALASCGGNDSDHGTNDTNTFAVPDPVTVADPTLAGEVSYTNVSVHDPSIIKDTDGTYYVFGSHLAYAKSTDLMNWEQLSRDGVASSTLFQDSYAAQVPEGLDWVGGYVGSWAPDVKILGDGKYHFFFDHCAGNGADGSACWRRSYLGVATADSITGPYTSEGIFLYSDQRADEEDKLPDGATAPYNGATNPNAIDPAVFNDADGGLWMTYGSYSGGIFVLQLDPDTGKPLPGQGFGTHVVGGNFEPVEGSYVIYSPETKYYYMFMSFAGFDQNGGYNIRVARATSPNGPYLDAKGQDMVEAAIAGPDNLELLGDYGVKLMGGFLFDANTGDAGTDHGYMSPGHNSAFYDAETGKYFLVFHTRFPGRGEGHEVRVHEMFMNADGWLVASPHRYAPISGDNVVDEIDVTGSYQFIDQSNDNNKTVHSSSYITLKRTWTNRGDVTGAYTGRYETDDDHHITLTLDGLGTYEGVVEWQYNDNIGQLVPVFTAISTDGATVWGSKLPVSDTAQAISNIAAAINLPESTTTNLDLVTMGTMGATISWSSSNPAIVSANGSVVRPAPGSGDATVTLTASITLNGQTVTHEYTVTIPARYEYNRVANYSFDGSLSDSLANKADGTYVLQAMAAAEGTPSFAAGQEGQALALDGTYGIKLPDGLIDSYEYTVSLWMKGNAFTTHTPVFYAAKTNSSWASLVPRAWDSNIMVWSNNDGAWYDGRTMQPATAGQWTHLAYSVNHGVIKIYVDGEERYSGGNFPDLYTNVAGTFALGVNFFADAPFNGDVDELKIYDAALSAAEIKALDIDHLDAAALLQSAVEQLDLGDTTAVTENLNLAAFGPYASQVSWVSANPSLVSNGGIVTRPTEAQGDQTTTLTATITLAGATATKEFTVTVRSMAAPTPLAEFNFDADDLSDAQGNFAAGSVTGALIGTTGGAVTYADGAVGHALVLDGSSGVQLPNNILDDNTYSISLWLNPKELSMYTTALFGYASNNSWISILPNGNSAVGGNTMVWSGNAWYDAGTTGQIPVDTWSHLVMVLNGGSLKIYVNGEEQFSGTGFPNIFGNAASPGFALGVNFWDTPYKGMIDEVQFFDNAISADDVQLLYREGLN